MESLFGSLDFCECEHCRSVLSPAAYLVDLLQFLDREPQVWQNMLKDWKTKHGNVPYPFKNTAARDTFLNRWHAAHPGEPDPNTERTPYDILIERRPDLPQIPLTCENTNTRAAADRPGQRNPRVLRRQQRPARRRGAKTPATRRRPSCLPNRRM